MRPESYNGLSVTVTKTQLNSVVMEVLESNHKIFWGFKSGKMILNIYNEHVNNKLTFIRHKGFLELIEVHLTSTVVKGTLNSYINFCNHMDIHYKNEETKSKEIIYQEIDYYLMKLFEERDSEDALSTRNIKRKLVELHDEWNKLQDEPGAELS